MKDLEKKILDDGKIINNKIIKVSSFINHQIDLNVMQAIAKEIKKNFYGVTKILTIEASGIAIAYATAEVYGNLPLVFAKKKASALTVDACYSAIVHSFTKDEDYKVTVDKDFINKDDIILIVDDFLAEGNASLGLVEICEQAGAKIAGVAVCIEKGFQSGRRNIEAKGIKVFSGACIARFENEKPVFNDWEN